MVVSLSSDVGLRRKRGEEALTLNLNGRPIVHAHTSSQHTSGREQDGRRVLVDTHTEAYVPVTTAKIGQQKADLERRAARASSARYTPSPSFSSWM